MMAVMAASVRSEASAARIGDFRGEIVVYGSFGIARASADHTYALLGEFMFCSFAHVFGKHRFNSHAAQSGCEA